MSGVDLLFAIVSYRKDEPMGNMFGMISVVMLACGLYCLYAWYQMKNGGKMNESLLLGKAYTESMCKDREAFMKKALPAVLIFGLITTLYGAVDVVNYYVLQDNPVIQMAARIAGIVFVVNLVWYIIYTTKLKKLYF